MPPNRQWIDESKLTTLYHDLGQNMAFFEDLVDTFRDQSNELLSVDAASVNSEEKDLVHLADLVHKMAGSTTMVGPGAVIEQLLGLEERLRNGSARSPELVAVAKQVSLVSEHFAEWVARLPPDPSA